MPMIPPAILPAPAQLLLAIDPHSETGGVTGVESPFSALLEAQIDAGIAAFASAAAPVPGKAVAPPESPHPASGKHGGKTGGKILPDLPQYAAKTLPEIAAGIGLPGAAAENAEAGTPVGVNPEITPADFTALLAVLPATPPILAAAPGRSAEPGRSAAHMAGKAPASAASVLPLDTAAMPEAAPQVMPMPGQQLLATFAQAPGQQPPADAAIAIAQVVRLEEVPAIVPTASTAPIQQAGPTRAILVPIKQPGSKLAAISPVSEPQPTEQAQLAAPPLAVQVQNAPVALGAAPQHVAKPSDGEARGAAAKTEMPTPSSSDDSTGPVAPLSQLALPEYLPLNAASQSASPLSPSNSAPTPASPAQHDFAALIDRLVEARQTAQTSLSAQTVTAAVTHAEFGQVSLQFRQDADGLSVVMAGADPDLARAVQVASPAAQAGANSDSNFSARQEPGGQQSASASQTQSQAQAQAQAQAQSQQQRGQAPQRFAEGARSSANPSPRQRDQDDPSSRGGIFA